MASTSRSKQRFGFAIVASLVAVPVLQAGCRDDLSPSAALPSQSYSTARAATAAPIGDHYRSSDEFFAAIDQRSPGFGGLYLDASGSPVAWVVDSTQEAAVSGLLAPTLAARRLSAQRLSFKKAVYRWTDLLKWKIAAVPILSIAGVETLDIDETQDRLLVEVSSDGGQQLAAERLASLGVPKGAVVYRKGSAPVPLVSLSDRMRPIAGGIEITRPIGSYNDYCSTGVNVDYDGVETVATAAHCTEHVGSVSQYSKNFYQPTSGSGNHFGEEYVDPPFFTRDESEFCPTGYDCRWSDAALLQYDDTVDWDFGHIARTTSSGQWSGSTTINFLRPTFAITSKAQWPFEGETLNKIGYRTGWTVGTVTQTCQYTEQFTGSLHQDDWFLLCYDKFAAGAKAGDSGSPVFKTLGGDSVRLYGILFGGDSTTYAAFANMANIENDFGFALDVTIAPPEPPDPPVVSISGPSRIKPGATCTWTAVVTQGDPPFVYEWKNQNAVVSDSASYSGGRLSGSPNPFTLTLTVTNAGGSDTDQLVVHEDAAAMICFQ
ncbi:MAG: S1 family peptidase [Gemmatimonadetes bacterium]|jgi:hypothetical protein|nr:S1 family peptidase [Gemmatimonadota bacterium]